MAFARVSALHLLLSIGLMPQVAPPLFRAAPPAESGIVWVHDNGRSPQRYLPETLAPGVALFDYDGDGWMDILFTNGGPSGFYRPDAPGEIALYHNNHDGAFTNVSVKAGLKQKYFGMGAAAGDYDGDGYPDIYITGFDRSYLYHNQRDGTFVDVSAKAGVEAPGWSTSALWFDYDNDGKLDLFVPQFVDYSNLRVCSADFAYGGGKGSEIKKKDESFYCIPRIFDPKSSRLFRNNGDGAFTDVSKLTGIAESLGKGLGAVATDINHDGFMDIFQANDTVENFLFVNEGGKRFVERGLLAGVAFSQHGPPRSGMGVDSGDVDGDGFEDLFVANVDQETFSLYLNDGQGSFSDISGRTGIATATRLLSGWGLRFFDYDNDGMPDLMLANGHPDDRVNDRMNLVHYREPLLLFHNLGGGQWENVSARGGPAFKEHYPARGLAAGDLNNDGFLDVVIGMNGEGPLVLENTRASKNHWIGLKLRGERSNPDGVGAVVRWSVKGQVRSRLVTAGGSYLSSHDSRIVLGLGASTTAEWVEIRWPAPANRLDRIDSPPADRYLTVVEGKGLSDR